MKRVIEESNRKVVSWKCKWKDGERCRERIKGCSGRKYKIGKQQDGVVGEIEQNYNNKIILKEAAGRRLTECLEKLMNMENQ